VRGQRGISPWIAAISGTGCEEYRSLFAALDKQGAGLAYQASRSQEFAYRAQAMGGGAHRVSRTVLP